MIRLSLLSVLLAAGMCGSSDDDLAAGSPSTDPAPPAEATEAPSGEGALEDETSGDTDSGDPASPSSGSSGESPVGTWQLVEMSGSGSQILNVATITWTFHADGTGSYVQDVKNIGGVSMDAADGGRPFQWSQSGGVVSTVNDPSPSTFTPTSERRMRWVSGSTSGVLERQ